MPKLTEYKDMNPRAKAVVEGIARRRAASIRRTSTMSGRRWRAIPR